MGKRKSCKEVARKVGAWANVTKVIMGICFSFLFLLGFLLFVASAVSLADANTFLNRIAITKFKEVIVFALCLGLFVAIVSIVGALGYFTLNKALLIIFAGAFIILAILQVACGAAAFAYRKDYPELIDEAWNMTDEHSRAYLEETFHCCGGINHEAMPASEYCVNGTTSSVELSSGSWSDGCVTPLADYADDCVVNVAIGDIVITILELAVVVVTIVVVVKIHGVNRRYQGLDDSDALEGLK